MKAFCGRNADAISQKAAREKAQLLDSERTLREQMKIMQDPKRLVERLKVDCEMGGRWYSSPKR